jgi:hypothetical protein
LWTLGRDIGADRCFTVLVLLGCEIALVVNWLCIERKYLSVVLTEVVRN